MNLFFQIKASMQKMFFIGALLTSFISLISCSSEYSSSDNFSDPYIETLSSIFNEVSVSQKSIPLSSSIVQPVFIVVVNNGNSIVVADNAKKTLFLINQEGEILSQAGMNGRGPGEYEMFSGMHLGYDDRIYVKDSSLRRITTYEVVNNEIRLFETNKYESPESYQLYNIYVTEYGNFGLYNESEGYHTPENRFLLYLLDEEFKPIEQKLIVPGEERQPMNVAGFLMYPPHDYTDKYIWHFEGDTFYYVNNYSSLVRGFNVNTWKDKIELEVSLPERTANTYYISAADEAYNFDSNKEYWSVLEDLEILPILSGIWVDDQDFILSIRPAPNDDIMMLSFNNEKKEISYFMLPSESGASTFSLDTFYTVKQDSTGQSHLIKTYF